MSEIIQAADAEDRQFFVSLGKTLEKGLAPNLHPKDTDQYQLFLVKQWVHFDSAHKLLHDPKRSLCYYGNKIIGRDMPSRFPRDGGEKGKHPDRTSPSARFETRSGKDVARETILRSPTGHRNHFRRLVHTSQ